MYTPGSMPAKSLVCNPVRAHLYAHARLSAFRDYAGRQYNETLSWRLSVFRDYTWRWYNETLSWIDSWNESLQHEPTPMSATVGSIIGLGGLVLFEHVLKLASLPLVSSHSLLFIGSHGALAAVLYTMPYAHTAVPSNILGGHLISTFIAWVIHQAGFPLVVEKLLSPSLSIGVMLKVRVSSEKPSDGRISSAV